MTSQKAMKKISGRTVYSVKNPVKPKWIGVDWGTSNMRVFAIDHTDRVVAELESDQGMGSLAPEEFEDVLINLIDHWLSPDNVIPVLACGMVGARQGWKEAQYRDVPCAPVSNQGLTTVTINDTRLSIHILPGLSQQTPADVMRGEETQIAGLLQNDRSFSGIICLPGTHSKWVSMSGGVVTRFKTFMTGELFSLLNQYSVLRHSLSGAEWDVSSFLSSALRAIEEPESVPAELFSIRAASLIANLDPISARSSLSGMLIGQELSAAQSFWLNKTVTIIGATEIASLYADALTELGVTVSMIDARDATISGLRHAAQSLIESPL